MPTNACFSSLTSVGVPRLRRVLRGLAWLYPDIGYCQGTGMVRGSCIQKRHHTSDSVYIAHVYTFLLFVLNRFACSSIFTPSPLFFQSALSFLGTFFTISPSPTGGVLSAALPWGGGCLMDDVRADWRTPSSILLLLHSAGSSDWPKGPPSAYCSVPTSPRPSPAGAWHRYSESI